MKIESSMRVGLLLATLVSGCCRERAAAGKETRVVSLAPNLTEMIGAIGAGDQLVGRTSACNYPPDIVANTPIVGDFGVPSLELLVSVKPTLILNVDLADETIKERIGALGLQMQRIPCRRLDDIPRAILTLGKIFGRDKAAAELANRLANGVSKMRAARVAQNPPAVFVEIWRDPLMTAGKDSFIAELVRLAGGRNIGDEIDSRDYVRVSAEWVVARNPDVILCMGGPGKLSERRIVLERTGWQSVNAIRNGRVYDNFDLDLLSRPGPRILEGVGMLKQRIGL